MAKWVRYALVSVSLLGLASACGGSDDGDGGDSDGGDSTGPIAAEDFPDALVGALCSGLADCCEDQGEAFSVGGCQLAFGALLGSVDTTLPEGVTHDPDAARRCVDETRAAAASCSLSGTESSACAEVQTGSKQPGEACEDDRECALPTEGEAACDFVDSVCVVELRGQVGDDCSFTCFDTGLGYSCSGSGSQEGFERTSCYTDDGLYCGASGTCEEQGAVGVECSGSQGCVDGLFCDFDTGVCAEKREVGGACTFDECVDSAFCLDGECSARLAEGEACTESGSCLGYCDCGDDFCSDTNPGTCVGNDSSTGGVVCGG